MNDLGANLGVLKTKPQSGNAASCGVLNPIRESNTFFEGIGSQNCRTIEISKRKGRTTFYDPAIWRSPMMALFSCEKMHAHPRGLFRCHL